MPRGVYVRKIKPVEDRFWAMVDVATPDDCWVWTGTLREGYGRLMHYQREDGRPVTVDAHRLSYFLAFGVWPPEDCRHRCHVRSCVNPAHLVPGTRQDNMDDMVAAGRSLVGERQPNHKLTWAAVREARAAHQAGQSGNSLAKKHGVSGRTMRQCLNGETWKMESGER